MTDCCSSLERTPPAVGSVMVVDSILEALSSQKVKLPVPEAVRTISYSVDN